MKCTKARDVPQQVPIALDIGSRAEEDSCSNKEKKSSALEWRETKLKIVLLDSASAVYQLTLQEEDQIVERYIVNSTCPETRQSDAHSAKLTWRNLSLTNTDDIVQTHTHPRTASTANSIELDVRFSNDQSCALLIDALAQVRHLYIYTHTHTSHNVLPSVC